MYSHLWQHRSFVCYGILSPFVLYVFSSKKISKKTILFIDRPLILEECHTYLLSSSNISVLMSSNRSSLHGSGRKEFLMVVEVRKKRKELLVRNTSNNDHTRMYRFDLNIN